MHTDYSPSLLPAAIASPYFKVNNMYNRVCEQASTVVDTVYVINVSLSLRLRCLPELRTQQWQIYVAQLPAVLSSKHQLHPLLIHRRLHGDC